MVTPGYYKSVIIVVSGFEWPLLHSGIIVGTTGAAEFARFGHLSSSPRDGQQERRGNMSCEVNTRHLIIIFL